MDSLGTFHGTNDQDGELTGPNLLVATFKHMLNPYQLLIIPLTIWIGFEQAFIGADFTAVNQLNYCTII